jgi:DNA-binding beta-propeller fold protein YncE
VGRVTAALLVLAALAGCTEADDAIPLHFDGPVAAAVLGAGVGPWRIPTGFVANSRDGTIVPLDLLMGRLLTDDPTASFLRSGAIATGHERILSDVAVVAGSDGVVTVWAIDQGFGHLLQIPYVVGLEDGAPVEFEPVVTEAVFTDADGSGDAPELVDLRARAGFTTTEDWVIEHDGERWWVVGTRSGEQVKEPVAGEPYQTDDGELAFTLEGTGTAGDRFELSTDTGLVEIEPGARPMGLLAADTRVYASLQGDDGGRIAVYDGLTGVVSGEVDLGQGSAPGRLAAAPDGRLFVTDAALSQVWILRFDLELDPALVPVESVPIAAPAVDIAWQGGEDALGAPFDHLLVAPVGLLRVDVYDTLAAAWVDPNPLTPEVEGVFLGAPVSGLGASVGDTFLPHETEWGGNAYVPTVAVATGDGYVYEIDASTGCLVLDEIGPYAGPVDETDAYIYLLDQGEDSSSALVTDLATGWQVIGATCGGVTRTETWTVIYDAATLSWEVEGSLSGVQTTRAVEGERYLSDTGAVSFTIRTGVLPPTTGDRFVFLTEAGAVVYGGSDENQDAAVDRAWESPARPVGFETFSGPTGGGWDETGRKQHTLLPVTNSDFTARIDLDARKSELIWE